MNGQKTWTQSLIITLPKKGNLQLCQNYRTISLISHSSTVMLKIILNIEIYSLRQKKLLLKNRLVSAEGEIPQNKYLRVLGEKYSQHQQDLYHVFIDFKTAFDRVWHDALWATMKKYNMGQKITNTMRRPAVQ